MRLISTPQLSEKANEDAPKKGSKGRDPYPLLNEGHDRYNHGLCTRRRRYKFDEMSA
jgi:hypothetical protein